MSTRSTQQNRDHIPACTIPSRSRLCEATMNQNCGPVYIYMYTSTTHAAAPACKRPEHAQWHSDVPSNPLTKQHDTVISQYRHVAHPIQTRLSNCPPPLPQNPIQLATSPRFSATSHCAHTEQQLRSLGLALLPVIQIHMPPCCLQSGMFSLPE